MSDRRDEPRGSFHIGTIFVPEPGKQHLFLPIYLQVDDDDNEDIGHKEEPVGGHQSERDDESERAQIDRIPDIVVGTAGH